MLLYQRQPVLSTLKYTRMARKRKVVNEDWSVLRNPSPFKIGPAPGFVRDNSPEMTRQYFLRRAEEENSFNTQLKSIGQLEAIEPEFITLFQKVAELHGFVLSQKSLPLITSKQKAILDGIAEKLERVNLIITKEVLADLDKLTVDFKEIAAEHSRGEV